VFGFGYKKKKIDNSYHPQKTLEQFLKFCCILLEVQDCNLIFFTFDALVMLINFLVVFHYISFFFFTISTLPDSIEA